MEEDKSGVFSWDMLIADEATLEPSETARFPPHLAGSVTASTGIVTRASGFCLFGASALVSGKTALKPTFRTTELASCCRLSTCDETAVILLELGAANVILLELGATNVILLELGATNVILLELGAANVVLLELGAANETAMFVL